MIRDRYLFKPILVAIACTLTAGTALAEAPRHLRITWTQAPATEATVGWTSERPEGVHVVYFDTVERHGDLPAYAYQQAASLSGFYDDSGGRAAYQHAYLEGLSPSTRYYFVVVSEGEASPEMYFETAHVDDRPFALLYGGDSRSNSNQRQRMNRRMAQLVGERPELLALAHGGDYTADGDSWPQWQQWLDDHTLTSTPDRRVLPIIPARGNHEGDGVMYNQVFGEPAGSAINHWSTLIGPQFRLITLDSEASLGGDQRNFLEQQLGAGQEQRWILANYHRPAYPAVKSPGAAREFWVPLFSEYKVDLVCESDGHALKRTVPIRDESHHPEGVVYVGEGGLGVDQRSVAQADAWYFNGGFTQSVHHVQMIEVDVERLRYSAIAEDGRELDQVEIAPKRVGTEIFGQFRSATWDEAGQLRVEFDKAMDPVVAGEPEHWDIVGLQLAEVRADESGWSAELEFTFDLPGIYVVKGPGLLDLAGQSMAVGTEVTFEIPETDATESESDDGSDDEASMTDDGGDDGGDGGDETSDVGDGPSDEASGDDGGQDADEEGDSEGSDDADDGDGDGGDDDDTDNDDGGDDDDDERGDDDGGVADTGAGQGASSGDLTDEGGCHIESGGSWLARVFDSLAGL